MGSAHARACLLIEQALANSASSIEFIARALLASPQSYRSAWYRVNARLSTWFRRIAPPALAALVAAVASLGATRATSSDQLPLHALSGSSSLYLREAASGPVRWQSWGESTLALARELDRPLLIDVGAVWCHWCHVMDQTTYADPAVANLINQHFIPIKVDSDQQPDVDSYYQTAAARLSGADGWPLTCFAMPNGALFAAFGYLAAGSGGGAQAPGGLGMVKVLQRVIQAFTTHKEALARESAQNIAELMQQALGSARDTTSDNLLKEILSGIRAAYDKNSGGFGGSDGPRFYDFPALELGLSYGHGGQPGYTAIAIESLRKMADGGVYDQLGGGFHRYSTDARWRLPHFEKLLYDQAMGLESYCEGYQATGDDQLARVARGITNYVAGSLLDPKNHVFYAHQDADAFEGDDGSYYTWTRDEIAGALPPNQAAAAMAYFGVENDPARTPDSRIVLRRAMDAKQLAQRLHLSEAQARELLSKARSGLLAARERRRKPAVDTAILVDRNALAAKAYLIAAAALNDPKLRKIALDDLEYLRAHARAPDGSYFHVVAPPRCESAGLLSDQVYVLDALLAAYQSSGEQHYLAEAKALADLITRNYFDSNSGLLHDRAQKLPATDLPSARAGVEAFYDRPLPSPQAVMALALQTLAVVDSKSDYAAVAAKLLAAGRGINPEAASMVATFAIALERQAQQPTLIMVAGSNKDARTAALREAALAVYRPSKIVITIDQTEDQTDISTIHLPKELQAALVSVTTAKAPAAFVCSAGVCANPVTAPGQLGGLMQKLQTAAASHT
jgi:uncharacterized protein YyaL (SSP411 family)